jgi:general secretion pathway protein G
MMHETKRGFTLIELLLVLVILSILAAVIVPVLAKRPDDARYKGTVTDINVLKTALGMFHLDNGRYPSTEEGLEALVVMPGALSETWKGPYVEQVMTDKWGNAYRYGFPAAENMDEYYLYSTGKDGIDLTADDITRYTVR